MDGFDEAVLQGNARLDVEGLDLVPGRPALEFVGDKLRAVVRADVLRSPCWATAASSLTHTAGYRCFSARNDAQPILAKRVYQSEKAQPPKPLIRVRLPALALFPPSRLD
jgi:hypothetical protein